MVKKTLMESFEIKPRNVVNTNIKDYDVFSDIKLLEELRNKVIQN